MLPSEPFRDQAPAFCQRLQVAYLCRILAGNLGSGAQVRLVPDCGFAPVRCTEDSGPREFGTIGPEPVPWTLPLTGSRRK